MPDPSLDVEQLFSRAVANGVALLGSMYIWLRYRKADTTYEDMITNLQAEVVRLRKELVVERLRAQELEDKYRAFHDEHDELVLQYRLLSIDIERMRKQAGLPEA